MTLLSTILKKVQSKDTINKKYTSPPPEIDENLLRKNKTRKRVNKKQIRAIVNNSSPYYKDLHKYRNLIEWEKRVRNVFLDNARMLIAIVNAYMTGRARVVPTSDLNRDWSRNKLDIIHTSKKPFILFPVQRLETMEDVAFEPPDGFKRPRAYITLRMRDAAVIGTMAVELFEDVCPETCRLFLELLDGDGLGHGYVGTQFFRKVPYLYWSGGDVIYNNGFGCYAQRGRLRPIAAENYHFSHSMPGLLSMRVSSEGLVCGVFNVTFKALPQFDLKNVVFGRIVRPSLTYEVIRKLGSALSSHTVIEIAATRRRIGNKYIHGSPNTVLNTKYTLIR